KVDPGVATAIEFGIPLRASEDRALLTDCPANSTTVRTLVGDLKGGGLARSESIEPLQAHARHALLGDAERPCGGKRKIDDASVDERPAVVDADDRRAAVFQVRHPQASSERERRMRRGHGVFVESLAARGSIPLMALPVPGGAADLGSAGGESRARGPGERARARREEQ